MSDVISRQDATSIPVIPKEHRKQFMSIDDAFETGWNEALSCVYMLPSAQPDIIRCKDCKYQDENWRRVSVRWLPCMDVRTGSNWFCGSAERRTDE